MEKWMNLWNNLILQWNFVHSLSFSDIGI